jgi:hypothetical protein
MRTWLAYSLLVTTALTACAGPSTDDLAAARAEIAPLFEAMQAAANEHDAEGHVSFDARDPTLLFVINDEAIVGWDALLEKQRQWWQDGKTDVAYIIYAHESTVSQ